MSKFVENTITPLTLLDIVRADRVAFPERSIDSHALRAAHIILETGLQHCHCWNVGNVKWTDGYSSDYTMFRCGEVVLAADALEQRLEHPDTVCFKGAPFKRGARVMQEIILSPPHPWTRFRAFPSLEASLRDLDALLHRPQYAKALKGLVAGDVHTYASGLRIGRYYTADVGSYSVGLKDQFFFVRGTLTALPTLRLGATGEAVKRWQRAINRKETGAFDEMTAKATKSFQLGNSLTPDRVVGPRSWGAALSAGDVEALAAQRLG